MPRDGKSAAISFGILLFVVFVFALVTSGPIKDRVVVEGTWDDMPQVEQPNQSQYGKEKYIQVTHEWISDRPSVPEGSVVEEISRIMGGPPTRENVDEDYTGTVSWTFRYGDSLGNTFTEDFDGYFVDALLESYVWNSVRHEVEGEAYKRTIALRLSDLWKRYDKITTNYPITLEQASETLGGSPYEAHYDKSCGGSALWRFQIDGAESEHEWAIYKGIVQDGTVVRGYMLP